METARVLTLTLLFLAVVLPKYESAGYCTMEICKSCCKPTNSGCTNAYTATVNGFLASDLVYCGDCECNHPTVGCAWIEAGEGPVACTSCAYVKRVARSIKRKRGIFTGCGELVLDGTVA